MNFTRHLVDHDATYQGVCGRFLDPNTGDLGRELITNVNCPDCIEAVTN